MYVCDIAESRAKKKKDWEAEDYYGSDDDEFLDRTGDIERKRKMRMKIFGHKLDKAETFSSLVSSRQCSNLCDGHCSLKTWTFHFYKIIKNNV